MSDDRIIDLSKILQEALGGGFPVARPRGKAGLDTVLFSAIVQDSFGDLPKGLTIGLKKDIFGENVPEPEESAVNPFASVRGPFGMTIQRVAFRMTPNGPVPVDLNSLKQQEDDGPTLGMSGRVLFAGEDPGKALTRATRYGIVMAGMEGVEGCRLFRQADGGVAFEKVDGVKGFGGKYFARLCQGMAGVATLVFDKTLDARQPISATVFAKVILPNLTEAAGLGHAVSIDAKSEPTRRTLGLTWMPSWKVHIDAPQDGENTEVRPATIIHQDRQIFRGILTLEAVRDLLLPVIRQEAEAFLGRDYQWDRNAELLREIVQSTDTTAQWVQTHVPMKLRALPPPALEA